MSLMIPCPHCGPRPVTEFVFGEVPEVPDSIVGEDARDLDRSFMRKNIEGAQIERWFHTFGCRRWITIRRDTRSDVVLPVASSQ